MANKYQPSAGAVAAARALWRNFTFQERTNTAATPYNTAVLIDLFTQIFRVQESMEKFTKNIQWLDEDRLREQMEEAREALYALQIAREKMPTSTDKLDGVSAPAWAAAKAILQHFILEQIPGGRVKLSEKNVAICIDVSIGLFRVEQLIDGPVAEVLKLDKNELGNNLKLLQETVRAVELQRNRLPRFGALPKMSGGNVEPKLTAQQKEHFKLVATELAKASTPAEQTAILHKAGMA
jgi:hypothetical protein